MKVEKQLSLFLQNKPGVLAGVCEDLAEARVNVLAISVADHVDHAVVRLVASPARKAIHILGNAGLLVVESDILAIDLRNQPAALAKLSRKLAQARVNIDYAYGSAGGGRRASTLFLHVSDLKKAQAALRGV